MARVIVTSVWILFFTWQGNTFKIFIPTFCEITFFKKLKLKIVNADIGAQDEAHAREICHMLPKLASYDMVCMKI